MSNRFLLTLAVFLPLFTSAQIEEITPLYSNFMLESQRAQRSAAPAAQVNVLPFFEDFSTHGHFPDTAKFSDRFVFINSTFPVSPPSIGVATFDGLNDWGKAYAPNNALAQGPADTLTAWPFDLSSFTAADSIYLSFAYQPQGIGNDPQPEDSLVLQFLSSDSIWYHVWSTPGTALHGFKQVIVPVTNPLFLANNFSFRFINFASLAGSFDHWHVDYIFMDDGRHKADTIFEDVALVYKAKSLLKNYHEMPWYQYVGHEASETATTMEVTVKNNYNQPKLAQYQFAVYDQNGGPVTQSGTLGGNLNAGESATFSNPLGVSSLPGPSSATSQVFEVVNWITPSPDFGEDNDTVRQYQRFDHHYAYDDGSAEAGYSLNAVGAQLGYQFSLNKSAVITAVAINWNFANGDMSQKPFRFAIWSDDNGKPGSLVMYKDSVWYPEYNGVNGFKIYKLYNKEQTLSGTFHIGWIQDVSNDRLNVGFDRNTNHSDKIHFNVNGTWMPSQVSGSLLIRPIFGQPDLPVTTPEEELNGFRLYPNPATEQLNFSMEVNYKIVDLSGRTVCSGSGNAASVSQLASGIYLVISERNGSRRTDRVVIH